MDRSSTARWFFHKNYDVYLQQNVYALSDTRLKIRHYTTLQALGLNQVSFDKKIIVKGDSNALQNQPQSTARLAKSKTHQGQKFKPF